MLRRKGSRFQLDVGRNVTPQAVQSNRGRKTITHAPPQDDHPRSLRQS
jgi:hypothetical protein